MDNILIGGYIPGNSRIHRLHAGSKLIVLILLLIVLFFGYQPYTQCATVFFILIAAASANFGVGVWFTGIRRFSILLAIVFLMNAVFFRTGKIIVFYGYELPFTFEAIVHSAFLTIRIAAAIVLSLVLTFTTNTIETARSVERFLSPLERLRIPVQDFSLMIFLALRFIPLIQMEIISIYDAQRARGIYIDRNASITQKMRNMLPILVPAFLAALRRSDHLADALMARGYEPGKPRVHSRRQKWNIEDSAVVIAAFWLLGIHLYLTVGR